MKIKFCSHAYVILKNQEEELESTLNPSWLFLKTYYDLYGLNPKTEWLRSELLVFDNKETIVKNILNEKPNILGLGVYIWNEDLQMYIAKKVKESSPDTIIVVGGPQLSVHRTDLSPDEQLIQDNFFQIHPYIDYSVYGDGEKPFQQIIDYESGFSNSKEKFVNIVENKKGKRIIYPYEMLTDEKYLDTSPYLTNKNLIKEQLDYIISRGVDKKSQVWALEFARGCMYKCSFCDWSQNLTKKVKRRTHDWRKDLEFWRELDVGIRETDANFGQWKEDIEIYDYALELSKTAKYFKFPVINTSKLKKDVTGYISIKNSLHYNEPPHLSFQDTDEKVLAINDRPSATWEKIKEMVDRMEKELPTEQFQSIQAELILGLPGQTFEGFCNNIVKLHDIKITNLWVHFWQYLPNAPATDPMYKKIWGINLKKQYMMFSSYYSPHNYIKFDSIEQLYEKLSTNNLIDKFNSYLTVFETKTMSFKEMIAAMMVVRHYKNLKTKNNFSNSKIQTYLEVIKQASLKEAEKQWQVHKPFIEKYNFTVWGNYDTKKNILHSNW